MTGRKRGQWLPLLIGFTLLAALGASVFASFRAGAMQVPVKATVSITVNNTSPLGTSSFSPGMTYVDNSLVYPSGANDPTAIQNVKSLIGGAIPYQNTPIMGWGLPDPWPDPSSPEPTNWSALDARLSLTISTGGIPVITLCEAPWWMKGQLQPNGTTLPLTQADEWSTRAFSSRILDNEMSAWLLLVQRVAERYMAPPYNVRYFQVWNELKGYYNPIKNSYDYTTSAGHPGGPNATHGYTYMYNRVYHRLMSVATSLSIPTSEVRVGGPYVVMDTWSTTHQSNPSKLTAAYGTYDERPMDVVKYWLIHKAGAAFISVDAYSANKDGVNITDAATSATKFADIVRWIRSLDNTVYPGAASLPIWLGEWYARPYKDWADNSHSNAIKTYAMMEFIKAGGAVALAWGGTDVNRTGPRLWTNTGKGGGTALPFYYSYKDFKEFFGPGVQLYNTTITPPGLVDAMASANDVMLVNISSTAQVVSVDGTLVSLNPYQVTVVHR